MANHDTLKSLLVSLGKLTLQIKDHLSESFDQDTYVNLLEEVKQSIGDVESLTATISKEAETVDGEVYIIVSDARSWQIKLINRIHFLESLKLSAISSVSSSNVIKMKPGRLPEVKLVVFKGDFEEWENFWSSFRANVDARDDLENATKFIYLAQSLEGEPKEMISGLARTEENYAVALYILRKRYANESKQTNVLMQRFHAMSTPKHNSKDLRVFLTEYRKIKHQLSRIVDFQANELVIKSVVVRKLPFQTFDRICDIYVTHDFTLDQLETGIQHIVDKLEQATLALAEGSVVKPVGVETQSRDLPSRQSRNNTNQKCSYCSGEHPAHKCSKYRTIQSRKDRLVKLRLCYCCLSPGHSSKMCHSSKTCRSCGGAHHSSLCYKSRGNNSSNSENSNQSNSSSQGKTGSSSSSSHHSSSANSSRAQAQSHPTNKPVVTPSRSSSSQANVPSPNLDTTYVTNVNSSNFPNNVLPTATLKVSYCNEQANVRAFFDTGSHRSFISPDVVKRLNLRVLKQVPVNLSTFGNDTESCMLDLVRVKVRFGKSKVPLTMLVHDSAAMGYFNSPGLFELAQKLEQKGFNLADRNITSDALTGIEILIGVDNFTRLIVRQRRSMGASLFVTKGGGVIPFGPLPKWATTTSQQSTHMRCARIVCSEKPEFDVGLSELWELERVGILPDDFSPSERETINRVRSNIKKSESGYIVQLPFKDDMRPAVNYRTARGQLNHLVQRAQNDEQFGQQYDAVVNSYVEKDFIEEVPNQPIEGHYMPHHAVFKKSATTPLRIVFNASSKPKDGKSLNDCLLTGPSLTAKLHEILVQFRKGIYAVTADISKAFHRIIVDPDDRKFLKFLWQNPETEELVTYQFRVVLFGATCSPYLLQETLYSHLSQSVKGTKFREKFYVDNYMNTYSSENELIADKVILDDVMTEASMPLQEWVSNDAHFNSLYNVVVPETQSVLGLCWNPITDSMNVVVGDKLDQEDSWRYTKRSILSLVSSIYDPLGWVSPLTVRGKMFLQTLWKEKRDWDETLNPDQIKIICEVLVDLKRVSEFVLPRHVLYNSADLHVFADASSKAYGAVAYPVDSVTRRSNLLVSKARVAPCKEGRLTIPKLELTASLIGARLIRYLSNIHKFKTIYLWSDSKVVISWITGDRELKDVYVANRVAEVKNVPRSN